MSVRGIFAKTPLTGEKTQWAPTLSNSLMTWGGLEFDDNDINDNFYFLFLLNITTTIIIVT